jgi:hypothetical protein
MRLKARLLLATAVAVMSGAGQASSGPLSDLHGRWSGWGSIVMNDGSAEQVKCVATYFGKGEAGLQQNIRCASASFRIDAVANLDVKDGQVSGRWEERMHSAGGTVSGRTTQEGLNVSIRGQDFSAAMVLTASGCNQSINIAPQGIDIQRIAIGLGKC